MERLIQKLTKLESVGVDTPVFIYHLEAHEKYAALTQKIFSSMENGKWQGVTSTITLMEINVHPWRIGREDVARKYEALLMNFPNLNIIDIDRDVARIAAQLRARFDIRPPDALQVAASLTMGARGFLTNDRRLSGLRSLTDIIVLDDYSTS
ncbi:MAG: type II toxin-antitoxin system VapC family toxin [Chloroflexi bacterium]|nr:MAG: type II toxin-antitoxin system VapC family toxin [Chloroflexota bacterium]